MCYVTEEQPYAKEDRAEFCRCGKRLIDGHMCLACTEEPGTPHSPHQFWRSYWKRTARNFRLASRG